MMRNLITFVCVCVLVVLGSGQTVFADIAKPKQPEQKTKVVLRRRLDIVPEGKVWQARLQLTQSDLQELRAALDAASADAALGSGNAALGSGNVGLAASIAQSPVRTIVAGLLLFLSVSFAGVWFARSARRGRKVVAVGILVVAMLGAVAIITRGNAGPPPGYLNWVRLSKNFAQGHTTSGDFVIEVVPDEPNRPPGVKLLIPYNPKQAGDDE